ncbi:MAG: HEAT repeat domain-containing protein [Anaerolineae bacterium]|nr:HEAT repeat domain-containing protein [Anaerolineae bacterium]
MLKIFLSYAPEDGSRAAERLRQDLQGHTVWDAESMRVGADWKEQVIRGLYNVDAVLILLTPRATASAYVTWEWEAAQTLHKPIIPLMVEPCAIPQTMTHMPVRDLSRSDTYKRTLAALIADLFSIAPRTGRPNLHLEPSSASLPLGPYTVLRITPPNAEMAAEKMGRIELQLAGRIAEFDPRQLIKLLSDYLELTPDQITVLRVTAGSVWVEIELPINSAKKLYFQIATGLMRRASQQRSSAAVTQVAAVIMPHSDLSQLDPPEEQRDQQKQPPPPTPLPRPARSARNAVYQTSSYQARQRMARAMGQTDYKYDAFISYARRDGLTRAMQLESDLRAEGFTTWRDTRDLDPDQDFTVALEHAIEQSARVIVCITPDTRREDNFVRREIGYALALRKPVIPLIFESTVPPISIINVHHEDFTGQPWDTAVIRLCRRLRMDTMDSPYADEAQQTPPHDPYRDYLNRLYQETVHYLNQTIFSMNKTDYALISLTSEPTPEAIDQADPTASDTTRVLPVTFFDMAGLILDKEDQANLIYPNFRDAFERYAGRLLLLGEPGAGKTTTLMAFARNAISRRLQDPNLPLPIIVPVVTWDAHRQPTLIDWLDDQFPTLKRHDLAHLIDTGGLLLLLDGLDELGSVQVDQNTAERYDPRVRFIRQLPDNNQIVVSCRVQDYNEMSRKVALYGAVTLQPLNDQQMHTYLRDLPELWEILSADPDLLDIARTPLLLSLFAFTYRDQRESALELRELHENPGELRDKLFETYIKQRYARESRRKHQAISFTLEELYAILGQLAMRNFAGRWRVTENVLTAADLSNVLPEDQVGVFTQLAILLGILVPEPASNAYRFAHRLMRDYLAYAYALQHLHDPDPAVRIEASETFRRRVDARAFDPLINALQDTNGHVRSNAAAALGQLEDPRAIPALITVLEDDTWNIVRISAAHALGNMAGEVVAKDTGDPDPTGHLVTTLLEDSDWRVRRTAARILGELKDRRTTRYLIDALHDKDSDVRYEVARALGDLGDPRAIEPLTAALSDIDPRVRRYAIMALGAMKVPAAVAPLAALLNDTHRGVTERICDVAALALEQIGTEEALAAVAAWRAEQEG